MQLSRSMMKGRMSVSLNAYDPYQPGEGEME